MTSADPPSPFAGTTPVARTGEGTVTLVEGRTFVLCGRSGDIGTHPVDGLFVLDARVLSRWTLTVNGQLPEPLAVDRRAPFAATFVGRCPPSPGRADGEVVVLRERDIDSGMRERITLENYGLADARLALELTAGADFAGLFEVKDHRVPVDRGLWVEAGIGVLRLGAVEAPGRSTTVLAPGAVVDGERVRWDVVLAPGEHWTACIEVRTAVRGSELEPRFTCAADAVELPVRRMAQWRERWPRIETDAPQLDTVLRVSEQDLGALRIFDPEHPDRPVIAAGAPWFMTVFGRDSLLTAWMALLADPTLAATVLETLARFQGRDVDPVTEEEPGRILHELRLNGSNGPALGESDRYYGSIDATPLFVVLLGELERWTGDRATVDRLLPAADRALSWIEQFGDLDGDGFVEYRQRTPRGLANQGWKDSWDAVRHADGTLAEAPIAMCEVQAYVYAAYVARAEMAGRRGDGAGAARWWARASDLRRRFDEQFWLPDLGTYALALDAAKRPVAVAASNAGHCLWAGIAEPERAAPVAASLLGPAMFTGWGVRTLSATARAYNPVSYHNGSVWPHDNALCAAGLARYGLVAHAHRLVGAQLDAAGVSGGRLPELFAGFERARIGQPVAYPTSCSPQAWASAAPLLWLRTMLRLDPDVPAGRVWLAPSLPEGVSRLHLAGIALGDRHVDVHVDGERVELAGVGELTVERGPRPAVPQPATDRAATP